MTKRRAHPRPPFRSRRLAEPRSPEDNVRTAAAWVVEQTLSTLAPSAAFLDSALARIDELDHALLRELALGTLRWLRRLDHVIGRASDRPFEKIEPALRTPLRIAAYQLLYLDRVPAHAAVNEGVSQALRQTHRGGASFANAVLRRIARNPRLEEWPVESPDPITRLAIEKSHPDFLVKRWLDRFGRRRTLELLDVNNRPKALQLLAFRDRGGREILAEHLIDQGVAVEPSALSPLGLVVRAGNPLHAASYRRGDFYVQDEASQAAALLPPPRPGERIFDVAAAPGGKSFTLLATEPSVRILLADVSPERLTLLRRNLRRLRRELPLHLADAGQPALAGPFDRIVVDLPCTGTGTLRKNPELKWRISETEIGRLARQAFRMLVGSAPLVDRGGCLVAITCSLEPEENEEVIERFLAERPDFALLDLEGRLPFPLERQVTGPGRWLMLPENEHDGFTVHVLVRGR